MSIYLHISGEDGERLFTKTETQKMIDSAVDKHDQLKDIGIQEWQDLANSNSEKCIELLNRNNVLRIENEELKSMILKPIEINNKLSKIIELFKDRYNGINDYNWEYKFIEQDDCSWLPEELRKYRRQMNIIDRLNIVKNGYIVKPEPTLEEKILELLELSFDTVKKDAKAIIKLLKAEGVINDEN